MQRINYSIILKELFRTKYSSAFLIKSIHISLQLIIKFLFIFLISIYIRLKVLFNQIFSIYIASYLVVYSFYKVIIIL